MQIKINSTHTLYACYIGYITQAIVNNFLPLLFLTLQKQFSLSLDQIAFLTTMNFGIQLLTDFLASKYVDRIGYRTSILIAHALAFIGLVILAIGTPFLHYGGILLSVVCYAIGGGLIEVIISPMVEACPTPKKEAAMSLLHSFYCWGHMLVIILSSCFFYVFGVDHWAILALLWACIPLCNFFYFTQVPIYTLESSKEPFSYRKLFKDPIFWYMFVFMMLAGANEQSMSQWASAFVESSIHVSKAWGDLLGPCSFALLMGISRAIYAKMGDRISLISFMQVSVGLCLVSYLLAALSPWPVLSLIGCGLCGFSVGILWPGTFSLASRWNTYGEN